MSQIPFHKLIKLFPSYIKPSYECMVHKKVSEEYDLAIAIPYGKRAFMWFTIFDNKSICCIIELNRNSQLQDNVHIIPFEFHRTYYLGTILSGFLVEYDEEVSDKKIFLADDIYSYKGLNYCNPFPVAIGTKMSMFSQFFKDLSIYDYGNYSIHTVVMWYNSCDAELISEKWIHRIGYPIKTVQYRCSTKVLPFLNSNNAKNNWTISQTRMNDDVDEKLIKNSLVWSNTTIQIPSWSFNFNNFNYKKKQLFWIQADVMFDVYYIYAKNNVLLDNVLIPDMKTSFMMNKVFRKIPENDCLDKIEESDDEEDFEEISPYKYLKTSNKKCNYALFECIFSRKFKKWIPLEEKQIHLGKFVRLIDDFIYTQQEHKNINKNVYNNSVYNNSKNRDYKNKYRKHNYESRNKSK